MSLFGLEGLLGTTAAATTGATTALAPAAGSGLGAAAGGGATGLSAQMGAGTSLFAPSATQAVGGVGLTGAPAVAAASAPAYSDIAIKMGGLQGLQKAGKSLLDPNMALQDKFNAVAPEVYGRATSGQADFAKLQQGAQPMNMPSYQQPYSPYQGGGIEEILKRQQGLLR